SVRSSTKTCRQLVIDNQLVEAIAPALRLDQSPLVRHSQSGENPVTWRDDGLRSRVESACISTKPACEKVTEWRIFVERELGFDQIGADRTRERPVCRLSEGFRQPFRGGPADQRRVGGVRASCPIEAERPKFHALGASPHTSEADTGRMPQ